MNELEKSSYCEPLIGQALRSVERKDCSWFFAFTDETAIVTESPWRFLNADRIVVTSEDHGHPFGLSSPIDAAEQVYLGASNRTVVAASISPMTSDLLVDFGSCTLQFLQLSSGYESWRLLARGGQTISTGGGNVVHFPGST